MSTPATILQDLIRLVRTPRTDRQLAGLLAFTAGAIDAGGFLALQRHAANMTGTVVAVAGDLASEQVAWAIAAATLIASFVLGAAATGALITRARRLRLHGRFAHPLVLEAALLLLLASLSSDPELLGDWFAPSFLALMCFIMGLQNAALRGISRTQIGTTHMTGILTDLGMEAGRWVHGSCTSSARDRRPTEAEAAKLRLRLAILGSFVVGVVGGAFAFADIGFVMAGPMAVFLVVLAAPPMLCDLRSMDQESTGDVP